MNLEQHAYFIASETERMEKAARRTWIIGAVVLVLLSLYFSFILTMVKTFLEPEVAAQMVSRNVKRNFPTYLDQTEELLAVQSEVLAEEMSRSIVEVFPALRFHAEAQMARTYEDLIPHISTEFQTVIMSYVRENRDKIQLIADPNATPESREFFIQDTMDTFGAILNETMAEEFDGKDLKYLQQNSLFALEAINNYLDLLLETEPENMNRSMVLHKQLLATITKRAVE